jgi:pyruvate ferredoxin oxidoreductase beta subunit/2-oxoisovalerate ferredoxin oxidoreductase beta subunit
MELGNIRNELVWPGSFACPGCGLTIALRHVFRALGKNTIVITSAGCASVVDGYYPYTASKLPFFHCSFGTAAATATGLRAGLDMLGKTTTNVLAWAGDGGTFDIGFQSLSGAAERNENIIYVCYDNEAYMNTGVQRSSATPFGSWTTTTPHGATENRPKKDIVAVMAAHGIPYIATACISYPKDLEKKARKAKAIEGFRFIHVLAPCPTGWHYPTKNTIRIGRLAVLSRIFPLYEVVNGREYQLSVMGDKIPVDEYLGLQGRFRSLSSKDMSLIQENIDSKWNELKASADEKKVKGL